MPYAPAVSAHEILGDALLIIGAGLAIAAAACISTALGLAAGALICLAGGLILTALTFKRPPKPGVIPNRQGPFEQDTPPS